MEIKDQLIIVEAAARAIYPNTHWHATQDSSNPTDLRLLGNITFYAQMKLNPEHIDRTEIVAMDIESVKQNLDETIRSWLEGKKIDKDTII